MKLSLDFCNWQQCQRCPSANLPFKVLLAPPLTHFLTKTRQQQLHTPLLQSTALQFWPMFLILLLTPHAKYLPCPFPRHLLTSSQSPSPTHLTFRNPKPLPSFVTFSHPQTTSWSPHLKATDLNKSIFPTQTQGSALLTHPKLKTKGPKETLKWTSAVNWAASILIFC